MYAAIRRYQTDPQAAALVSRRVTEDFVPLLRRRRGFVAYYAVNAGDGVLVSISVYADQAAAEASSWLAAEWVSKKLGPLVLPHPPEITVGEVVAHGLGDHRDALPAQQQPGDDQDRHDYGIDKLGGANP